MWDMPMFSDILHEHENLRLFQHTELEHTPSNLYQRAHETLSCRLCVASTGPTSQIVILEWRLNEVLGRVMLNETLTRMLVVGVSTCLPERWCCDLLMCFTMLIRILVLIDTNVYINMHMHVFYCLLGVSPTTMLLIKWQLHCLSGGSVITCHYPLALCWDTSRVLLESHLHGKLVIKMLGTFLDRTIGHGIGSSVQGRPIFWIIATLLIKVLINENQPMSPENGPFQRNIVFQPSFWIAFVTPIHKRPIFRGKLSNC